MLILTKSRRATMASAFMAIAPAVGPRRRQPRALPVALDPCHHFQLSDWSQGFMRHLWKRLTGPRADRPRWRATVLAVATAVAPRRTRPMAVPVAVDPPDNYPARNLCLGAMRHLGKRLTGPRADRPRWRATVLDVCDGCSAATDTTDGRT